MTTVTSSPLVADRGTQRMWRDGRETLRGGYLAPSADTRPTVLPPRSELDRDPLYAHAAGEARVPQNRLVSRIDQGRFWVGAVLVAAAAGLAGVISMIVANGILRVPVVFGNGTLDLVHISTYGMIAAAVALVVAGLYDAMIHFAPRPGVFFGWLGGLATLLAALMPFTTAAPLQSQLVLGGMNLLVGAVILALVPAAAVSARRRS